MTGTTATTSTPANNSIVTSTVLNSMHSDFVHHVEFDSYGRRMATCSGDRTVRVWDLHSSGEWLLSREWQASSSSITQIKWSHASFGVVATCSNVVTLWEEWDGGWMEKATLADSRKQVTCCEFAMQSLLLAAGSLDGQVRVYEAVDTMNLAQWTRKGGSLHVFPQGGGVSCLSWSKTRMEVPTLVVGGGGGSAAGAVVYRYSESQKDWQSVLSLEGSGSGGVLDISWAPNVGRRFHWIAMTTRDGKLRVYELQRSPTLELKSTVLCKTNQEPWKCQWNVTGTVLATSGDGGMVQLWKYNTANREWNCVSEIHGDLTKLQQE